MLLKRPALEAVQSRIRGARPPPGTPAWPGPARPHESHDPNRAGQWLQGDVMPISQGSRAQAPRDEDKPVTLWLGGTRGPPCTVKQVRRSQAQSAVCGAHRHTAFLLSGEAPRQQSCRSTANQGTARTAAEPQQEARTDGGAPTPRAARSLSAEPARRARGPGGTHVPVRLPPVVVVQQVLGSVQHHGPGSHRREGLAVRGSHARAPESSVREGPGPGPPGWTEGAALAGPPGSMGAGHSGAAIWPRTLRFRDGL